MVKAQQGRMGGKAPKKSRKLDHGAAPDVTYSYHCLFLRFLVQLVQPSG